LMTATRRGKRVTTARADDTEDARRVMWRFNSRHPSTSAGETSAAAKWPSSAARSPAIRRRLHCLHAVGILISVGVAGVWEVIENAPFVASVAKTTRVHGYVGDGVVNFDGRHPGDDLGFSHLLRVRRRGCP
jgi:hypothetical protein